MKVCSKCGEDKSLEEFPRFKYKGELRYRAKCSACFNASRKAKDAAYRERNRERVREQSRRWCRDNPEVSKRYYQENKEAIDKKNKEYAIKNRGPLREKAKEWRWRNIEEYNRKCRERRNRDIEASRAREKVVRDIYKEKEGVVDAINSRRRRHYAENTEQMRAYALRKSREPKNRAQRVSHKREVLRNLGDSYIKDIIRQNLGVKNPPQELIELKRIQLKIHRALQ